jgi:polysaccharide biosynthesis transport protein
MNSVKNNRSTPQSGFNMHDIIFVVFKHKWMISFLTLLGLGAAGVLAYKDSQSPTYESKAKLLVRYVVERSTSDPDAPATLETGRPSMNTELAILTSWDLAVDTAAQIGPGRLLPELPVPPSAAEAATAIVEGLKVKAEEGTVIELSYRNSDSTLSVQVLKQLIQNYFEKHLKIHRSTHDFAQVARQADEARNNLRITEEEINRLKSESGVLSIESTITEFETRRQLVMSSLMAAQSALAEQRAKVGSLDQSNEIRPVESVGNTKEHVIVVPEDENLRRMRADALAESRDLSARLSLLQQERNTLLVRRPKTHPLVASLDSQIEAVRQRGIDLVERFPETANLLRTPVENGAGMPPAISIEGERALLVALEARVEAISQQVKEIESEVQELSSLGSKLSELERSRQMEEEKFRYFQTSLEKARVDDALDPSKIPNISIIQNPSTPEKSLEEGAKKAILGVAGSGLAIGLALAFLIEFVIDRKVSRPTDIQSRLQLPLMLTIPYMRSKDGIAQLIGDESGVGLLADTTEYPARSSQVNGTNTDPSKCTAVGKVTRLQKEHFITPFARAIHDRILFNFEINNINHKPKLVGLTGLSVGAGCSTIAAGLAKEFADHEGLKVLLIDLNSPLDDQQGSGHPAESLYKALKLSKSTQFREDPRSLYFANAPTRRHHNQTTALTPVALQGIMPHLVASDFDYIFFDMPPMDLTSPTIAMAGFMDKVLLILDAKNTNPDSLNWAYRELEKGKANVSCIFNKARSYAPRWVQGEV